MIKIYLEEIRLWGYGVDLPANDRAHLQAALNYVMKSLVQ